MTGHKHNGLGARLHGLRSFFVESLLGRGVARFLANRLYEYGQFVYLTLRGFSENRGTSRAAALAYTTLLALIPLLAVALSVSKNFLHSTSADLVPKVLDRMVAVVSPQVELIPLPDDVAGPPAPKTASVPEEMRRQVVERVQSFIDRIHAGALGTVGTIFLVFIAINLLMAVEQAFNDIWGVHRGRSLFRKVVYYWTAITLGPLLLFGALAVTSTVEFSNLFGKLGVAPWLTTLLLQAVPFVILWIGVSLMCGLMPNTKVRTGAAIAGGIVGGTLLQLNSLLSTLYLSRVMTYNKLYGALGLIPVFLLGLYLSWLSVLLGAQVSFTAQNFHTLLKKHMTGAGVGSRVHPPKSAEAGGEA